MQDIGSILREGRTARGLAISDVARTTCISARYLRALEEGRFNIIPNVFDRGYLRIYANFLDIDARPLLDLYEQQKREDAAPPPQRQLP